jgi:hypothetical protein
VVPREGALAASVATVAGRTRALLVCGALAGPLFIVVSLTQAFTRPGFDIKRHGLSMLSLGDLGWVQISNFLVTGLLAVCLAVGMRRALHPGRAGTWGPRLIGVYGVGILGAGIFRTDPALGFPPGTPAGMPATLSWHADLHNVAFLVAFTGLTAACFVVTRRFAGLGKRGWAIYCAATGLATPVLVTAAFTAVVAPGAALASLATVTSVWIAVISMRLLAEAQAATA